MSRKTTSIAYRSASIGLSSAGALTITSNDCWSMRSVRTVSSLAGK